MNGGNHQLGGSFNGVRDDIQVERFSFLYICARNFLFKKFVKKFRFGGKEPLDSDGNSLISAPAGNVFPEPQMTIPLTVGSLIALARALSMSAKTLRDRALTGPE